MNEGIVRPAPLVTAAITTFRRPHILAGALKSALRQTYRNIEVIVVDDFSQDETEAVVAEAGNGRARYIRHYSNRGLGASRNTALDAASGMYIAYLDDDDEWLPEKVEKQVSVAEGVAPDCAVVYCGGRIAARDGRILSTSLPAFRGPIQDFVASGRLSTIPSTPLFRTDLLRRVGGYDATLPSHLDHDVWMSMALAGLRADYVNEPLVTVGAPTGRRMTSDTEARWKATAMYFKKWRPHLVEWMGEKGAARYETAYFMRVMGAAGRDALRSGRYRNGIGALARVVRRWPARPEAYITGGRAIAGAVYDLRPARRG